MPTTTPAIDHPTNTAAAARFFVRWGAILAAVAVGAGAFGAHALDGLVTPARLDTFGTAARYQMYHALGLWAVAWGVGRWPRMRWTGYLFLAGIVLFSGSLYALVLTDTAWLGAITPLGGVAFISGWLWAAWATRG